MKKLCLSLFIILLSLEVKAEDEVFFKAYLDKENPIEQSQVIYTVKLFDSVGILKSIVYPPKVGNLALYPLVKEKKYVESYNGKEYLVLEWKYAFFPNMAGRLDITPPRFEGEINQGLISGTPNFYNKVGKLNKNPFKNMKFSSRQKTSFSTEPQSINVLPNLGGEIVAKSVSISEKWDTSLDEAKQGDALNRSLLITFTGFNPSLFKDIRVEEGENVKVYSGKTKQRLSSNPNELIFEALVNFTYVPSSVGFFSVPEFSLKWLNSENMKIETASIPMKHIEVKGVNDSSGGKLPAQEEEENRHFYEDMKIYKWFNLLDTEALLSSLAVILFLLLLYVRIRKRIKGEIKDKK